MATRLGIDVGGTFTDLLLFNDATGDIHLLKTPSTPEDQSVGILKGIERIVADSGVAPDTILSLLHGTTVSTNIVLEEKGAKVGLIVTENFEQVLHMARSQTPGPLAGWMIMVKPDPLADLEATRGVPERVNAHGDVVTPLNEARVQSAVQDLSALGVESITVALLHAYANPIHERRIREIIRDMGVDFPVSLSSDILPEFREYERTLVAVMNAYVRPAMRAYLRNFEEKLRAIDFAPHVSIIRSDGGLMSVARATESPVHTMLSGPAGGVSGAAYVASSAGFPDALGFDMGGTSTDVSMIRDGKPVISRQTSLGYYPIKIPSVEVHSVGAGGGSIAHVPLTGALRVGPESAGAMPGPACYSNGGDNPTVTDANVVLGRLPPSLLGGEMQLDIKAAEDAMEKVGRTLGLDACQAAQGILDIVNENMFGALRLLTVQKGLDPRDFALVAFGGAGPMHGNALAALAGCFPVVVPPTPGVLSALGFLSSDVKNEFARTFIRNIDDVDGDQLQVHFMELGRQARAWLHDDGVDETEQNVRYEVDVRYLRQGYEFTLDAAPDSLAAGGLADIADRFGAAHEKLYGFRLDQPVELVNLRAVGSGAVPRPRAPDFALGSADAAAAVVEQHQVYFDGAFIDAEIYDRSRLVAGNRVVGPAIIMQTDTTTVVHPGYVGRVDTHLNFLINPANAEN